MLEGNPAPMPKVSFARAWWKCSNRSRYLQRALGCGTCQVEPGLTHDCCKKNRGLSLQDPPIRTQSEREDLSHPIIAQPTNESLPKCYLTPVTNGSQQNPRQSFDFCTGRSRRPRELLRRRRRDQALHGGDAKMKSKQSSRCPREACLV